MKIKQKNEKIAPCQKVNSYPLMHRYLNLRWIFPFLFVFITACQSTLNIRTDKELFKLAKSSGDIYYWECYLREFPNGKYVREARKAIRRKLSKKEPWKSIALTIMPLDDIDGAAFDPADGQLRIWGEDTGRLPPLLLDDLVMALKIIGRGEDIGVSIEPPQTGKGEFSPEVPMESMVIYIPSSIKNTHLGSVLYEIDRKLKCLSMGKDNMTGEVVGSDVPGFKPIPDRIRESHSVGWEAGYFGRMWFKPDKPELLCEGHAVRFGKIKMILKPESQYLLVREFATHMTDYFDHFARNDVVFAELIRLHKLIALARWLRDGGYPVDDFVKNYPLIKIKTSQKTLARFLPCKEFERTDDLYKYRYQFGVAGGVHFPRYNNNYMIPTKPPSKAEVKSDILLPRSAFSSSRSGPPQYGYIVPDKSVPPYCNRMNRARPTKEAWSWNVKLEGNRYRVVAIPLVFNKRVEIGFESH